MASQRDYRTPRNSEMRDLLICLPQPVRITDGADRLLWQNQAAESLESEPAWSVTAISWQGKKACLGLPLAKLDRPDPRIAELEAELERLRKHQRSTARRKKKAEESAKQTEKTAVEVEKREQKLREKLAAAEQRAAELERRLESLAQSATAEQATEAKEASAGDAASDQASAELLAQLESAEARYAELWSELEAFRDQTEAAASYRQLEEELASKVRELDNVERSFAEAQSAFIAEKLEWEQRLGEQESEFLKLRESLQKPVVAPSEPTELLELREEFEKLKLSLDQAREREQRTSEKLHAAGELKAEQSKLLQLLREELQQSREAVKLYEGFRDQARTEAQRAKAEAEQAREAAEKLEAKLLASRSELSQARSGTPAVKGIALPDNSSASESVSTTVKSQLEFAQSRLRDTEKQLDEARAALKKAQSEAISAKDTEKLAFQDGLTGLPNRHIVGRYLDFAHKQAKANRRAYSLFLIDLDGFRVFNDTFGRAWGDALLKAVGERLAGMRGANHVVARHSEDRFLLLAADLPQSGLQTFVEEASRSLLAALGHPFEVQGEQATLTGSIGVALGPGTSDDPHDMFRRAELALESAKGRGTGSYFVHNEALQQKSQRDATYLRQMTQAIERDEIYAVYQPIFNLQKGLVTGVELLLRWQHRDQRLLHPEEFLEVALRSGLIFTLADKVWPKAFRALARWRRLRPGMTLSINLSDRELLSPRLLERVSAMAQEARVEPQAILFEVRDASRLRTTSAWWKVLGALHGAGFGLVLDDFGSDASLFGTLAYPGFMQAKIVVDEKNPVCPPVPNAAKGILYCAKRIQTRFDLKVLKKAGFGLAQGYAVASPIEETDVDGLIGK